MILYLTYTEKKESHITIHLIHINFTIIIIYITRKNCINGKEPETWKDIFYNVVSVYIIIIPSLFPGGLVSWPKGKVYPRNSSIIVL